MDRLFSLNSPVIVFLTKVGELMILNVLTILLCLPLVTAGAALTALYYTTIRMVRDEETYIFKGYMKSFRENLKQSVIIWLIVLAVGCLLYYDFFVLVQFPVSALRTAGLVILTLVTVCFTAMAVYVFPVLSRFENTVKNTMKNAFLMGIFNLPRTILVVLIHLVPITMVLLTLQAMPVIFLFGFSGVAFLSSYSFSVIFKRYEPKEDPDLMKWKPLSEEAEEAAAKKGEQLAAERDEAAVQEKRSGFFRKNENIINEDFITESGAAPRQRYRNLPGQQPLILSFAAFLPR